MQNQNKKSLKWLWIAIAVLAVALVAVWCILAPAHPEDKKDALNFNETFVIFTLVFVIVALGYLLGSITIKGVNLGTAGVFLVAILVGAICALNIWGNGELKGFFMPGEDASIVKYFKGPFQNLGLILFVGAVGFIAGPNFFKNLKKNFKTYILLGAIVILSGTAVAVLFVLVSPSELGPEFWSGVLSGALTTTPGFSAAKEAAGKIFEADISLGHAIAYPFGVVGVVLFVQLMPKILKADMNKERELLKIGVEEERELPKNLFSCDPFGLTAFAIATVLGLLLGTITIPLTAEGYAGACFSLGPTGGMLIMCLVLGHFGRIGKLSFDIPETSLRILREFGLMLFLLVAGFHGGVALVEKMSGDGVGAMVLWGFIGGAFMTVVPLIVGFIVAKYLLKLPLLNNLGSITGGMTSTPALGTLISTAKTDDVASAYASTYPIALVLIVLACQLMIVFM
ncbi:MAG: permease [Clostridia bacterium]|nr:permease [Clostridia bacterium]